MTLCFPCYVIAMISCLRCCFSLSGDIYSSELMFKAVVFFLFFFSPPPLPPSLPRSVGQVRGSHESALLCPCVGPLVVNQGLFLSQK